VPTNKQRREAARRHLERQLQRRQQRDAARRRTTLIASIVGTIVLVLAVVIFVVAVGHDRKKSSAATGSTSASPSASPSHTPLPSRSAAKIAARAPKRTSGPCGYAESTKSLSAPNMYDVGLPPDPRPTPKRTQTVLFSTNLGPVTVQLDGASAPCNVQSLVYLIGKHFYDNTACPRSVNSGIFVVQCGDPSGTTAGGPTYTVKDESLAKASYSAGAIAMANSGPNSNGSQFFFITKDSSSGLGKQYTVVGHVIGGLNLLQKVANGGDDGSNQAGGGRPKIDLIFQKVTLEPAGFKPPATTPAGTTTTPAGTTTTPAASSSPTG
jgi:peptidyl-prolyl cis-trans isomerase B (cyclophilin B)